MGSITFQVIGDGSVGTKTKTFTVPDAHVNRLVAYAVARYSVPPATLNTTQALLAWAEGLMAGTKANVLRWEKETDIAAVPSPDPFDAT